MQVRQLLLDPAVGKEFERMKAELAAKAKEIKGLQEELQAVQFSQDSKAGRMLMAKCRALQVQQRLGMIILSHLFNDKHFCVHSSFGH